VPKGTSGTTVKREGTPPHRAVRKGVTNRLRALLAKGPCTIPDMQAALAVDEAAVLRGLRRLGKSKKGILHSGMVAGKPAWWCGPAEPDGDQRGPQGPDP
jgi:hypothetical protein